MSSRTYLSIGDVLTLLREEFPDVTISKIRFLESQGLVNPERSPSGYRKFFDHDVERLRWVLRQQREHFLPLKVIRDRLAGGDLDEEPGSGSGNGATEQPTKADEEAMARILADASRRAAPQPEEAPARQGLQVVAERDQARVSPVESVEPSHETVPSSVSGGAVLAVASSGGAARKRGSTSGGNATPAPKQAPAPTTSKVTSGSARPEAGERRGQRAAAPAGAAGGPPAASTGGPGGSSGPGGPGGPGGPVGASPASTGGMVTGASMTLQELCAASGLSPEEVAGLRAFGLVESVMVAGIETFDEDALTVANLATSFRTYGIEPRHLRLFRNAVDRELGLIEQVVIPLLRQRNPEARQRAGEAAHELAALGQSLRATLLSLALRRHLGG